MSRFDVILIGPDGKSETVPLPTWFSKLEIEAAGAMLQHPLFGAPAKIESLGVRLRERAQALEAAAESLPDIHDCKVAKLLLRRLAVECGSIARTIESDVLDRIPF